ncbi:MAG: helical backbone metal receptor [Chloroflexales bacterium]|nr:helical backbone metal receptor [Chloroflexales bacterium]
MIIDAIGRPVALTAPPKRIISLVPSLTEYLFAIGLGERVIGITEYCVKPADAVAYLPKVRGTKNPDRGLIRDLQPDLVLAAKEENRERDIVALAEAGISVYVTDICSIADALRQLSILANVLEAKTSAATLLADLQKALEQANTARLDHPPLRTLTFIWRDPWMAIGADTYADDLLQLCGAKNVVLHLSGRYPRAPLAEFLQLEPEVILLPNEPYVFTEKDLSAFTPFGNTPAVQAGRVYLCDGELLTWYGPRSAEALRTFANLLLGNAGDGYAKE